MLADASIGSWEAIVALIVVLPLLALWGFTIVDLFRRHDLRAGRRIIWLVVVLAVPIVGVLVYFLARPVRPSEV